MNYEKTCCVTGHRNIPEEKFDCVLHSLKAEFKTAIADGYTRFISGFAEGTDLIFAAIIVVLRMENPNLFLEAAIPYKNRLKSKDIRVQGLLGHCDDIKVVCEEYTPNCYFLRNRYMVEESRRVIAVYDGREGGGTAFTMRYALRQNKELRLIQL